MEKLIFTKKEFKEITEVLYCTSNDRVRPILQCVNFNNSEVVAVDGYRIAIRKFNGCLDGSYTIHRDCIKEVLKGVNKEVKTIEIRFDDIEVRFKFDTGVKYTYNYFSNRYVSYANSFPQYIETEITLQDPKELLTNIKLSKTNDALILNIKDNNLNIKIHGRDELDYNHELLTHAGENIQIAFNNKYIKDTLKKHKDNVYIKFNGSLGCTVITDNLNRIDLILPINIKYRQY